MVDLHKQPICLFKALSDRHFVLLRVIFKSEPNPVAKKVGNGLIILECFFCLPLLKGLSPQCNVVISSRAEAYCRPLLIYKGRHTAGVNDEEFGVSLEGHCVDFQINKPQNKIFSLKIPVQWKPRILKVSTL